jgi:hypothetical protein
VVEQLEKAGLDSVELACEGERLKLKHTWLLKQHREE